MIARILKFDYDKITIDRCYVYDGRESNCLICNRVVCSINIDGDFFTCPYLQDSRLKIGNIRDSSFEELFIKMKDHPFANVKQSEIAEPCSTCYEFDSCFGGCRGTAFVLNNRNLGGLDPQCEIVNNWIEKENDMKTKLSNLLSDILEKGCVENMYYTVIYNNKIGKKKKADFNSITKEGNAYTVPALNDIEY